MDVHSNAWQGLEHHAHALMTNGPCDQSTLSPRVPHGRPSRSHENEWERLFEELASGNNNPPTDFDTFSPPQAASVVLPQTPMRSIESTTSGSIGPYPAIAGSSQDPPPLMHAHSHQLWPELTAPTEASQSMSCHEHWNLPPSQAQAMLPHGPPQISMGYGNAGFPPQPQAYSHVEPSPFLHEGSPHVYFDENTNGGWGHEDAGPVCIDGNGSDECNNVDLDAADPCYAQLLYRCLKDAPGHIMALKDLYEWVKEHSQKAKDQKNRGWQNSVRHNLSMNAAFDRVTPTQAQGVKKGSLWRLTPQALRDGVISTTRYRKDPKRKSERRGLPALKRQISGAKGGQATRNATRRQQALQQARSHPNVSAFPTHRRQHKRQGPPFFTPTPVHSMPPSPQPGMMMPKPPSSPYFIDYEQGVGRPATLSAPQTPPDLHMMYGAPAKSALNDFEFSHIDFLNGGFIGNHDDFAPETPSLATEASFASCDDNMPMMSSHNASRETSSFLTDSSDLR